LLTPSTQQTLTHFVQSLSDAQLGELMTALSAYADSPLTALIVIGKAINLWAA
jgi:hypothetical protein